MTPAESLARSVGVEARAGQVPVKRCHWDGCPHGATCVHARWTIEEYETGGVHYVAPALADMRAAPAAGGAPGPDDETAREALGRSEG